MNPLMTLLEQHGPTLLGKLKDAGLSEPQAASLLPEIGNALGSGLASGKLDIQGLLGSGAVQQMLSQFDVGALASRLGIGADVLSQALNAVLPAIGQLFQSQSGTLEKLLSAASSQGGGEAMAALGNLAKGFFK
jgi:hypothetical protein